MWLTGLVALRHVGSSQTRARTRVPCIGRQILNRCATREAPYSFFIISCTRDQLLSKFQSHSFIYPTYILKIGHMPGTGSDSGDTAENKKKYPPSGSLLHWRVFLILPFSFLIFSPFIPVQKPLQSWPFKGSPVSCFVTQLKRAHVLGCQPRPCSCTTQQSYKWYQT